MAYAEHIPTQDPNKPEEEVDAEAGKIYAQLRRGTKTAAQIAEEMGISRRTLFNRLKMISALPERGMVRALHFDRLEELYAKATELIDDETSRADAARLLGESRQILARQAALLKLDEAPTDDPEPDDELDGDDWEVAE